MELANRAGKHGKQTGRQTDKQTGRQAGRQGQCVCIHSIASRARTASHNMRQVLAEQVAKDTLLADPVFRLDVKALVASGVLHVLPASDQPAEKCGSLEKPMLWKEFGAVSTLLTQPRAQLKLAAFGGNYKKSQILKETGKVQEVLYSGSGKEECDGFWAGCLGLLEENATVPKGLIPAHLASVMNASWLFGFDAKYSGVGATPNGVGLLRLQVAGEVTLMLFKTPQLVAALRIILKREQIGLEACKDYVQMLTNDQAKTLSDNGCQMFTAIQMPNQTLMIPSGWLLAECSSKGVLVYGLRKSFLACGQTSADDYESLIGCNKVDEKPVVKMEETLEIMKKAIANKELNA